MILFNLKCAKEHVFEGWFRNGDAYDEQAEAKTISCPVCGSRKVEKAPMAPRIGKGGDKAVARQKTDTEKAAQLMTALRELRAKVESESDYVGERFPEERGRGAVVIRGCFIAQVQAVELSDRGVDEI